MDGFVNEEDSDKSLKIPAFDDVSKLYGPDGSELSQHLMDSFNITTNKLLGAGAQGSIYLVDVKSSSLDFTCVDKLRKVINNDTIAKDAYQIMFKEFDIGRRLNHPGIVKTIYFLKLS